MSDEVQVHMCPLERYAVTECCGVSPFELAPYGSRMTLIPELVTCDALIQR